MNHVKNKLIVEKQNCNKDAILHLFLTKCNFLLSTFVLFSTQVAAEDIMSNFLSVDNRIIFECNRLSEISEFESAETVAKKVSFNVVDEFNLPPDYRNMQVMPLSGDIKIVLNSGKTVIQTSSIVLARHPDWKTEEGRDVFKIDYDSIAHQWVLANSTELTLLRDVESSELLPFNPVFLNGSGLASVKPRLPFPASIYIDDKLFSISKSNVDCFDAAASGGKIAIANIEVLREFVRRLTFAPNQPQLHLVTSKDEFTISGQVSFVSRFGIAVVPSITFEVLKDEKLGDHFKLTSQSQQNLVSVVGRQGLTSFLMPCYLGGSSVPKCVRDLIVKR